MRKLVGVLSASGSRSWTFSTNPGLLSWRPLETSEVISLEYLSLLLVELFFGQMIKERQSFLKSFSDFFELSKLDQQIKKTSECLFEKIDTDAARSKSSPLPRANERH